MYKFFDEEKFEFLDETLDGGLESQMAKFYDSFDDSFCVHKEGEVVEGEVIGITKSMIWVNLGNHFIGFIPPRELYDGEDTVANLKIGDKIKCSVIETENEDGYAILSLRKAGRERAWEELKDHFDKKTVLTIKPIEANKGGLLIEIKGIRGFLPVSQLAPEHYPRVKDGNEQEILARLVKLIKSPLDIRIISAVPEENKLIVSEKEAKVKEREEKVAKYQEGQVIKGKIIGLVEFGAFVDLGEIEGLIHISEISWERVSNVRNHVKEGEEVEVMVIGTEEGKVSLSLKRLKPDPWLSVIKNLKVGDKADAEVIRLTPFGAFVKLENGLEGLIHISELSFKHISNPADILSVGDKVKLKIINIDIKNHKIELSMKELQDKDEEKAKGEKSKGSKKAGTGDKSSIDNLEKVLSKSVIDKINKAGYKDKKQLSSLSLKELSAIPGIGQKTAEKIFKALK